MSAPSRARTLELVVLSGVSGSGKTTALHALEDAGYYCVDNLPSGLLQSFLSMAMDQPEMHHIALVMDIRGASQDPNYPRHLEAVADGGQPLRILFLDSADERIISRFKETRRRHPLIASGEIKAIGEAILLERERLQSIRAMATTVVDTTEMTVHDLRRRIQALYVDPLKRKTTVHLLSFGFRHGIPPEADFVFDVRFLTNPYFVPELRKGTGLDEAVSSYVLEQPNASRMLERITSMCKEVVPLIDAESRPAVTIAIGCTGGHHRSVTLVEALRLQLEPMGYELVTAHRDIKR